MLSAVLYFRPGPGAASISRATCSAASHPRQLARIVRAGQLMSEVSAAERNGEEEAQRRGLRVHLRGLRTLLDLCQLKAADVVAARGIRRAAEKSGKGLDLPDILVLGLVAEAADRHVCDHAAAQIADRLVVHRGSCPEVG